MNIILTGTPGILPVLQAITLIIGVLPILLFIQLQAQIVITGVPGILQLIQRQVHPMITGELIIQQLIPLLLMIIGEHGILQLTPQLTLILPLIIIALSPALVIISMTVITTTVLNLVHIITFLPVHLLVAVPLVIRRPLIHH